MLKKILIDIHTAKDNESFDQIKILGSIAFIIYNALAFMDVYQTKSFEYHDYALGLGVIFASICGGIWMKKDTEPGN